MNCPLRRYRIDSIMPADLRTTSGFMLLVESARYMATYCWSPHAVGITRGIGKQFQGVLTSEQLSNL